ncbi:MAG: ligase-associated DNA damage response endonuclease PdeM [Bosea sp. (in: a-proteobacteria)]
MTLAVTLAAIKAVMPEPMAAVISIGRLEVVPDHSGALWLPAEHTLVVADLHLEKGSAFAARGVMLPPYDSAATLDVLARTIARRRPARVIALGDSFHDMGAASRLADTDRQALAVLQQGRDWLWVTGNHDPKPMPELGGEVCDEIELSGTILRHTPEAGETRPEISGHLHPVAKVRLRGKGVRRRCFAISSQRCILPAMGAYAGGLNLRNIAFQPLFRQGVVAHMLGSERLFVVGERFLLPD